MQNLEISNLHEIPTSVKKLYMEMDPVTGDVLLDGVVAEERLREAALARVLNSSSKKSTIVTCAASTIAISNKRTFSY